MPRVFTPPLSTVAKTHTPQVGRVSKKDWRSAGVRIEGFAAATVRGASTGIGTLLAEREARAVLQQLSDLGVIRLGTD